MDTRTLADRDADAARIEAKLMSGETKREFEAMTRDELVAALLLQRRWSLDRYWAARRKGDG